MDRAAIKRYDTIDTSAVSYTKRKIFDWSVVETLEHLIEDGDVIR